MIFLQRKNHKQKFFYFHMLHNIPGILRTLSQLKICRSPSWKVTILGFWSKKRLHVLKPMKNNFPFCAIFIFWDINDFVLKIFVRLTKKNGKICQFCFRERREKMPSKGRKFQLAVINGSHWRHTTLRIMSQKMRNFLKHMHNQFSDFYFFELWSI